MSASRSSPAPLVERLQAGRRRLGRLLSLLALLLLAAAVLSWSSGRIFPGFLALFVAGVVGFAWRMSNDLLPRNLRFDEQTLQIETASRLIPVSIADATIRKLEPDEIQHLERLASAGGFVAGSGGFDSRRLGEFDLYGSDLTNAVFLQGVEGRWVVTPDEPDAFIEVVEERAASPATIPSP